MYKTNETVFLHNLMLSRECDISGSWDQIRWTLSIVIFSSDQRKHLDSANPVPDDTKEAKFGETKVP